MYILTFLIVLIFLGGIILLNMKSPAGKRTREQFLQELSKFLEGALEHSDDDNVYRIKFRFKGEEFVYEDHEEQGFKDKVYKAYLRVKTPSKLTLTFTEKKRSMRIKSDIFIASEVSTQDVKEYVQLQVPKFLKDLKVFTNNPDHANEIFDDRKMTAVLKRFKNVDNRGFPFSSLLIVKGEVILEFRSMKACYPNMFNLQADIPSIDDCLERLIVVVRKLKEKS